MARSAILNEKHRDLFYLGAIGEDVTLAPGYVADPKVHVVVNVLDGATKPGGVLDKHLTVDEAGNIVALNQGQQKRVDAETDSTLALFLDGMTRSRIGWLAYAPTPADLAQFDYVSDKTLMFALIGDVGGNTPGIAVFMPLPVAQWLVFRSDSEVLV